MTIKPLSEGSFTVDETKQFVPFAKDADNLKDRSSGSLLVEVQPFVVITEKDVILLDTGLGFEIEEGIMQLHTNLKKEGIDASSVTKVLLSHLHKDHAGGIADKQGKLSFPKAQYFLHEDEYIAANTLESKSYTPEDFTALKDSDQLFLLKEQQGEIVPGLRYELSGGHSPHHTVYWINENDETIFFGGDVAPQLQQMKSRLMAKYDFDGKTSRDLRMKWWEQAKLEHWTLLFYHDIKHPFVKP